MTLGNEFVGPFPSMRLTSEAPQRTTMDPEKITVKAYRRPFRRPLQTARGEWAVREGFILRVEAGGYVGFGEVAPLPEFGTETVSAAREFLEELVEQPELQIPKSFPCCAFALSAACTQATASRQYAVSALLPAGKSALRIGAQKTDAGYRNLKWKIGVAPLAEELPQAQALFTALPRGVKLRLDANASLTPNKLVAWLELLVDHADQVDYLEQPLPVGEETTMADHMAASGIQIALDESLNGKHGAHWLQPKNWAGPLVIKAALMGSASALADRLAPVADRVVLSSVFETGIGLANSLSLADRLPALKRPIGFDTLNTFDDALTPIESSPQIRLQDRTLYTAERIWNLI